MERLEKTRQKKQDLSIFCQLFSCFWDFGVAGRHGRNSYLPSSPFSGRARIDRVLSAFCERCRCAWQDHQEQRKESHSIQGHLHIKDTGSQAQSLLLVGPGAECTTPSHSQSLANFVANVHSQGISATRTKFSHFHSQKPFAFASEFLRTA